MPAPERAISDDEHVTRVLEAGVAHHQRGEAAQAEALYQQALILDPGNASAFHLLGIIASQSGQFAQAIDLIVHAIALDSTVADFYNSLGVALSDQGDFVAAIGSFYQALHLQPKHAEAHYNLGMALQKSGDLSAAVAEYSTALHLDPARVEVYNNLGLALQEQGELPSAITYYREALQQNPTYPEAHNNLGNALQEQNDLATAASHYREALRLRPNYAEARGGLIYVLQHLASWPELPELWTQAKDNMRTQSTSVITPFTLLATPASPSEQLLGAQNWIANRIMPYVNAQGGRAFQFVTEPKERLRIGYLSADFRPHAVAYLIAELFALHDRSRFDILAYSIGPADDSPIRHRVSNAVDRFRDLAPLSFTQAAQQIYDDHIDILVDLTGHTKGARTQILALRPAPIQVNYLGYPGTMGADFIDYILTDRVLTPPNQQPFFSEQFLYLPDTYQINDRHRPIAAHTPSRADCGLPEHALVFCAFSTSYKITPTLFSTWMRLLDQTPGSVLWLMDANPWVADNLRREAAARGIAPERLVFAPTLPLADHLARYRLADLFLDTAPYGAHTTASDALWAGLPVLTCAGETFASRVAASLLTALGLPDLITTSLADYEARALQLAHHPAELTALRATLAAHRATSPLFDSPRQTRHIEDAYRSMWDALVPQAQDV